MELISIVVPVFNCESYLKRCVDSIICQTYGNLEIILIDDGSTDRSPEICDGLAKIDSRVIVKHIKNSGPAHARNTGIDLAKGKYIGFVDSDDYIEPDMYKKLYDKAENSKLDVVISGYDIVSNTADSRIFKVNMQDNLVIGNEKVIKNVISCYYKSNAGLYPSMCNKLYNRYFLEFHSLKIDESLFRAEDYWFNFDVFCHAEAVGAVDQPLYHYVQTNKSSIMHKWREEFFEQTTKSRKKLLGKNKTLNLEIDIEQFAESYVYEVAVYMAFLAKEKKWEYIDCILKNEFYLSQIKFDKNVPRHIRLLDWFTSMHLTLITKLLLIIWSKLNGD